MGGIPMTEPVVEVKSQTPERDVPAWNSERTHILDRLEIKLDRHCEYTERELKEVRQTINSVNVSVAETREGQRWMKWLLTAVIIPTWLGVVAAILNIIGLV